jgi:hypothetical protein
MRPRTSALLLALISAPFVFPQALSAQDKAESSPLSVTAQFSTDADSSCKSGEGILLQFHYTGEQALRGYLVIVEVGDPTGNAAEKQTVEEIRDTHEPMIESGAEWTRTVCWMAGKKSTDDSAAVKASIDVLKFADNSIWGAAALRESHQLIGALDGMDFRAKNTELKKFVSPILPEQGPLPAQNVELETIGPLKIESGVWRDERDQDMLAADVTNESNTPIRGYVITESFYDPSTGARIRRTTTKELETQGDAANYLAPGATWVVDPRKFSRMPDGSLANYKITVDLVVFADGSRFGPKKSVESDEVLGMFRGIDEANGLTHDASLTPNSR